MLENLTLQGKLTGTFKNKAFNLEFHGQQIKAYFFELSSLKEAKDLFYDRLKKAKEDPATQALLRQLDIEVFLEGELIARVGKNAKGNFISNMLGLPFFEVVANSRMSDLMGLM